MMICSICLFINELKLDDPVTVINGQAVCPDHTGYVQGGEHSRALALVVTQSGFKTLNELAESNRTPS